MTYPAWDSLKAEDQEEAPSIILTVTDAEGRVVRRLTGPTTAGVQRVTWNLRYPTPNPPAALVVAGAVEVAAVAEEAVAVTIRTRKRRSAAVDRRVRWSRPGRYTVGAGEACRRRRHRARRTADVRGRAARLGRRAAFAGSRRVPAEDGCAAARVARRERRRERDDESHSVAQARVQETPSADDKLATEVRRIEARLREIQTSFSGDPTMSRRSEPTPPSLINRVNGIANSLWSNTMEDATATQKRQYEIASAELGGLLDRLRGLVETGSQASRGSGRDGGSAVDERARPGLEAVRIGKCQTLISSREISV